MTRLQSITKRCCLGLLFFGLALSGLQAAEEVDPHTLMLNNGDMLRGKMTGFDLPGSLGWARSDGIGEMKFDAAKIQTIDFGPVKSVGLKGDMPARLRLLNGDVLDGNITGFDTTAVKFDSVCAGPLVIPRRLLQSISPQSVSNTVVFDGITGTNGWTLGEVSSATEDAGYWSYQPGAFVATKAASVARNLHLPNQTTMEFDVDWRGTLNFAIAVFTDSLQPISLRTKEDEPPFAAFYSLQINSHAVSLLYVSQTEPLKNMGQIIVPMLGQKNEAHITIHASKDRRLLTLLIDGTLVKQWDDNMSIPQGAGVRFVHQGQGSIRMSNLRVREWDGRLDEINVKPYPGPDDSVITIGGEKLTGKLASYQADHLEMLTGNTPFKIAMDRVQRIDFGPTGEASTVPLPNRLARARLANGGTLTFVLRSWKDGLAQVTLPGIGDASIRTDTVQQLDFFDPTAEAQQPSGSN